MELPEIIKQNYLLIGVIVTALLIGIFIYFFNKPAAGTPEASCGADQVLDCNPPGCVQKCRDDQKYDCTLKTCVCKNGGSDCAGTLCCPSGSCNTLKDASGIPIKDQFGQDKKICCNSSQLCGQNCCAAGELCVDGKCKIACPDASNTCDIDETCASITNMPSSAISELSSTGRTTTKSITSPTGQTSDITFMCAKLNQCQLGSSSNNAYAPANINNIGLCINGTYTTDTGVGFCYSETDTNCLGKTKLQCGGSCQWIDMFSEAKQNGVTELNKKISKVTSMNDDSGNPLIGYGNWCRNPGQGGTSRLVAQKLDNVNCGITDCWNRLAQKGVVDVTYDKNTGYCMAIQNCAEKSSMTYPLLLNKQEDLTNNLKTTSEADVIFKTTIPTCSGNTNCNSLITSDDKLCFSNGNVTDKKSNVLYKHLITDTYIGCEKTYETGPNSYISEAQCMKYLQCPPGYIKGTDLLDSTKKYNYFPKDLNANDLVKDACYRAVPIPGVVETGKDNALKPAETYNGNFLPAKEANKNTGYQTLYGNWDGTRHFGMADSKPKIPFNAYYCKGVIDPVDATVHPKGWVKCTTPGGCDNPHYVEEKYGVGSPSYDRSKFREQTRSDGFKYGGMWHLLGSSGRYVNHCYCDEPSSVCRSTPEIPM